jgi:hypothetical protein
MSHAYTEDQLVEQDVRALSSDVYAARMPC